MSVTARVAEGFQGEHQLAQTNRAFAVTLQRQPVEILGGLNVGSAEQPRSAAVQLKPIPLGQVLSDLVVKTGLFLQRLKAQLLIARARGL